MKKIVVTGATGFVGYHVAKKLVEKNWGEIFCTARTESKLRYLKELGVRILPADLRDPLSLERALEGCDTLFHVAADYRLWVKNPEELIFSNVQGTENILLAAKKFKVKKIVLTSSVAAVGRPHQIPLNPPFLKGEEETVKIESPRTSPLGSPPFQWGVSGANEGKKGVREEWEKQFCGNESMEPTPEQLIGPYKKSKYQAELVARKFAREGLPVVIVNPSTPVGSHDIKPTPTGKLILDFLKKQMPAYLDTGLNLVDVEDVAEGHLLAAEKGKIGERYILGNKNMMLKEILDLLAKITGLPAPKFKIPYWIAATAGFFSTAFAEITGIPPAIPLDGVKMAKELMFYDSSRAVKELGMPQHSVEAALEKSVKFFRENGYC